MLKKIVYLLWLFSAVAKADIKFHEQYYSFLSQGFNFHNYQQCNKLIQSCPVNVFPDADCVEKILQTKEVCQQFAKLTDVVGDQLILLLNKLRNFLLLLRLFLGGMVKIVIIYSVTVI